MNEKKQMSDTLIIGSLLTIVGGFLDAYTYICRGGVFANAQTGNIVLLGVKLSEKNLKEALYYIVPILAFVFGIAMVNLIEQKYKNYQSVHWRQIVLFVEIVLLCVVANLPQGDYDSMANVIVSFVCSLQVESFKKVNGYTSATTMCTGNLRSGTEKLFDYFKTKDKKTLNASIQYYAIIIFFIIGAILGAIVTELYSISAVYAACLGLLIVILLLFKRETE